MIPGVAQTIYMQLGGPRFTAMTGSHHLVADGNTLRMVLARNKSKANRLHITYDEGTDLYTMRFFRITGGYLQKKTYAWVPEKESEVYKLEEVYADDLQRVFTEVTGLYTKL